jgi:hypothetical protein
MGLTLNDEQKAFIVRAYARFTGTTEICRLFQEEYNVELPSPRAAKYNCGGPSFTGAKKWQQLFLAERKRFLESTQDIGIANKTYRMQELHKLCVIAIGRKNVKLAAELMEQAAKEMGEVFTNKREIRADTRTITATMTTDELRNEILKDLQALGVDAPASLTGQSAPLQIGVVRDKDKDKLN